MWPESQSSKTTQRRNPAVKHLRFWILSSKNGRPLFFRIWIRTLVFLCMERSFRKSFMEMRVVMFFSDRYRILSKETALAWHKFRKRSSWSPDTEISKNPWSIFSGLFILISPPFILDLRCTAGRQPNSGEIYCKPERADCGNDFSNTL